MRRLVSKEIERAQILGSVVFRLKQGMPVIGLPARDFRTQSD
jgi:hypothetical protein